VSISVSEMLLVGAVALVVVKPEQLPPLAYRLGQLTKTVRALLNNIKQEINTVKKDEPLP
jgi:Sec-independent protein translocase protein TatA